MVGLKDVARDTGLSVRTVSRVMTGNGVVSEKSYQKVMESAKRLGYRPNRAARSLKLNQSYEIVVVVPTVDELFMQKIAAMEQQVRERGFWVSILMSDDSAQQLSRKQLSEIVEEAIDRRPAGIVLMRIRESEVAKVAESGIPYVIIDSSGEYDSYGYDSVNIDRAQGVYDAVKYLYSTGRRKIAFAAMGNPENSQNLTRLPGYVRAVNELDLRPILLSSNTANSTEQFEAGRYVAHNLPEGSGVDAIIAYSDYMAMGVLAGAYDLQIRVPDALAVVGFDDRSAAARSAPPLTTVRQPNTEAGIKVAEILLNKIAGEQPPQNGWSVILATELVVRESC